MSDAFFMATPLLAKVGKLTGDEKYFDLAAKHVDFMNSLVLRRDGLYQHSPETDAAWSRGNAFVALGLALSLSEISESHHGFDQMLEVYRAHLEQLINYQDQDGMWHQVIDYPG